MPPHKHQQSSHHLSQDGIDLDEYSPRFCDWQTSINLLTTLAAILLFLETGLFLTACNHFLATRDSAAIFTFPYSFVIWWFFAGISTTLSFELVLQIWSLTGHRHLANAYSEWAAFQPKSYRGSTIYMDSRSVFPKFFLFLGIPIGILTLLALNMHITFTQQEFHHCGYAFQPCSSLPYTSIHAIYAVDGRWGKGKFIPSPDIVIHFSDHTRWSEYDWTESNRKILDAGLLEFLTAKTSLQPIPIHLEQDLPQP